MARKHEASRLLKQGNDPFKIARKMGISSASVMQYLFVQILEGEIKKSDIFFSISKSDRTKFDNNYNNNPEKFKWKIKYVKDNPLKCQNNFDIFLLFRFTLGDMYELIADIEIFLHGAFKKILINEFGPGEKGWWRKGIPAKIRSSCAMIYEEDEEPAIEPFCYSNFIHLKKILNENWGIFSKVLPKEVIKNKKGFLGKFVRLNKIRNIVMHPIKGLPLTEDDFEFVKEFHQSIEQEKWRIQF